MKRTIILIGTLAASALLFSCSKNSTTPAPAAVSEETERTLQDLDPDVYLLSFGGNFEKQAPAQEEADTKVVVTPDSGAQSFEDGDEVLVYVPAVSAKGIYVYDATEAQFSPKTVDDAVAVGDNYAYAYYPAGEFSVEGGKVSFTMPEAVTELPGKKTPLGGILPAGASEATFKNLGSILRFSFSATRDNGETLTAVELSGEGVNITGKGSVTWSENTADGIPELSALDGESSLTLTLAAPLRLTTAPADVFFFLPPGGELANLTVKAIYGKDGGYAPFEGFRRANAMTLGRGNIVKVEIALSGFFGGGDGSAEHPYVIASADDFKAIATLANATSAAGGNGYDAEAGRTFFGSEGVHYQQTADIDFKGANISQYLIAGVINGTLTSFEGSYDGKPAETQYSLTNFVINATPTQYDGKDEEGIALFKRISGATLKNISISQADITGGKFTAGLVGYAAGASLTISGCSISNSTISASGDYGAAGLIGGLYAGTVASCSGTDLTIGATNTEGNKRYYGGLISYVRGTTIVSGCSLNGTTTVNGTPAYFGGIAGQTNEDGTTITGCENHSDISGVGNFAGGIVGIKTKGSIEGCTNDGSVGGAQYVGGIVGSNAAGNILGCINEGDIVSTGIAGGIAGQVTGGTIKDCTNESSVTFSVSGEKVGGIVGSITAGTITASDGKFTENKADIDLDVVVGNNNVGGIAGLVEAEITNVRNSGAISGYYNIGGIGGTITTNGSVENALSSGDVSGYQNVGGISGKHGHNANAAITKKISLKNCHVDGADITASANDGRAGGIAGLVFAGSWIEACTAFRGTVSGHQDVGGAIGHFNYGSSSTDKSNRVYVGANLVSMDVSGLAPINNTSRIGGFIGYFQNSAKNYTFVYQNGVVGGSITAEGCQYVGSFVGYASSSDNKGRIWDSYSLIEDSNFHVTTTNANIGGFAGGYGNTNVNSVRNAHVNSQNTSAATSGITKTTVADIRTVNLGTSETPSCNVDGSAYTTTTWSNPDDVNYPVPTILVTYGHYK